MKETLRLVFNFLTQDSSERIELGVIGCLDLMEGLNVLMEHYPDCYKVNVTIFRGRVYHNVTTDEISG